MRNHTRGGGMEGRQSQRSLCNLRSRLAMCSVVQQRSPVAVSGQPVRINPKVRNGLPLVAADAEDAAGVGAVVPHLVIDADGDARPQIGERRLAVLKAVGGLRVDVDDDFLAL